MQVQSKKNQRIYSLIFVVQMDEANIWKQRTDLSWISSSAECTHSHQVFYVLLQGQMDDCRPGECTLPVLKALLNFYIIKKRQKRETVNVQTIIFIFHLNNEGPIYFITPSWLDSVFLMVFVLWNHVNRK